MDRKILERRRRAGFVFAGFLAVAVTAGILGGCRDDLVAPTQGFLEVRTGGVYEVEIYLDGELVGLGPATLGPLPERFYHVQVRREGFGVQPADGDSAYVRPAETRVVEFTLELREFGSVELDARDELLTDLGDDVAVVPNAEIFREMAPGVFESTGLTTSDKVDSLPVGVARFKLRADGYEESGVIGVTVIKDSCVTRTVELAPARGVLAEMFTHIACINCPPAADSLEVIHAELPGEAFVIEWHVRPPYPLSDARWRQRLDDYLGATYQTVPTTIFGGAYADTLVGCDCATLSLYRERIEAELAECAGNCPLGLAILNSESHLTAAGAGVHVLAKWRGGSLPGNLKLRTVLIENGVVSGGYGSPYDFVAREMDERAISFPAPGVIHEIDVSLPVPLDVVPGNAELVVFIQSDVTREILQVTGWSPGG